MPAKQKAKSLPDIAKRILPIRDRARKKPFAVLDIETYGWSWPYALDWYDGTKHFLFLDDTRFPPEGVDTNRTPARPCVVNFLRWWLQPEHMGEICYAHNGGGFDFQFLFYALVDMIDIFGEYTVTPVTVGSSVFLIDITKRSEKDDQDLKWTLLDSLKLIPLGLDRIGKTFGLGGKEQIREELGLPESASSEEVYKTLALHENTVVMRKYLRRDTELLYNSIRRFSTIVEGLGGQVKSTIASTAMDIFRRSYMRTPVYVNRHIPQSCPAIHENKECDSCGHQFFRAGYYGGRTEIIRPLFDSERNGWDPDLRLYYYDFNSCYPSVMRRPMPVGLATEIPVTPELSGDELLRRYDGERITGFAECEVDIPEDCYIPPLPYRKRTSSGEQKLVFPVGKFRGVWDLAELQLLRHVGGKITRVIKVVVFSESKPLFRSFVESLYPLRDKSRPDYNEGMAAVAKLALNSSYGKWGEREQRERILVRPRPDQRVDGMVALGDHDGPTDDGFLRQIYSVTEHKELGHVAPQIAAHVTALSRIELWLVMWEAHKATERSRHRGHGVYYTDTDSVMVAGHQLPTHQTQLGALKLEHILTYASFLQPKLYQMVCAPECPCGKGGKATQRAKGLSGISDDEFRAIERGLEDGSPFTLERKRLSKFKEGLSRYLRDGASFPYEKTSPKSVAGQYDKRVTSPDRLDTMPLRLNNTAQQEPGSGGDFPGLDDGSDLPF